MNNDAPRHTAKQIADDVADGMDPDIEGVPAQYYDAVVAERDELKLRCEKMKNDIVALNHCADILADILADIALTEEHKNG